MLLSEEDQEKLSKDLKLHPEGPGLARKYVEEGIISKKTYIAHFDPSSGTPIKDDWVDVENPGTPIKDDWVDVKNPGTPIECYKKYGFSSYWNVPNVYNMECMFAGSDWPNVENPGTPIKDDWVDVKNPGTPIKGPNKPFGLYNF